MVASCHHVFITGFLGNKGEYVFHLPSFSAAVVNVLSRSTMTLRPTRLKMVNTSQKLSIRFIADRNGNAQWQQTIIECRLHSMVQMHSPLTWIFQQDNPPICHR